MNKGDVVTQQDIETYYSKCRKFRFDENQVPKSFEDLFNYLVVQKQPTYYVRGSEQCEKSKVRSLDDFLKIHKFYYPKVTVAEIIIMLNNHLIKSKRYLGFAYCPNIRKFNFQGGMSPYKIWNNFRTTTSSFQDQGFPNCNVEIRSYF